MKKTWNQSSDHLLPLSPPIHYSNSHQPRIIFLLCFFNLWSVWRQVDNMLRPASNQCWSLISAYRQDRKYRLSWALTTPIKLYKNGSYKFRQTERVNILTKVFKILVCETKCMYAWLSIFPLTHYGFFHVICKTVQNTCRHSIWNLNSDHRLSKSSRWLCYHHLI